MIGRNVSKHLTIPASVVFWPQSLPMPWARLKAVDLAQARRRFYQISCGSNGTGTLKSDSVCNLYA